MPKPILRPHVYQLTTGEAEALALLQSGLSRPQISATLGISDDAVRSRLYRAVDKERLLKATRNLTDGPEMPRHRTTLKAARGRVKLLGFTIR